MLTGASLGVGAGFKPALLGLRSGACPGEERHAVEVDFVALEEAVFDLDEVHAVDLRRGASGDGGKGGVPEEGPALLGAEGVELAEGF